MSRRPLTVLITTFNESANLPGCLESVQWADDILVVDSGSTDNTADIARDFGARLLEHPYESAAAQKNWAMQHCLHEWVLILDADERLTPELSHAIRAVLDSTSPHDGYYLRRSSFFLGHRIRHCGWDRDRVLRLFRKQLGRYDERFVHEKLQLEGTSARLEPPMLHYTYRSFSDYLERVDRYSAQGAADLARRGQRASVWPLLLRPPWRFIRMFFLQLGFLDGVPGFLVCGLASFSVWLKYARLYESHSSLFAAAARRLTSSLSRPQNEPEASKTRRKTAT